MEYSINCEHNNYIASLIKDLYTGENSQTKFLLLGLYFYYYLQQQDGKIYGVINKIKDDELYCHKLLAKIIVYLGDYPEYKLKNSFCFSSFNMEYPRKIEHIILYLIEEKEKYIIKIKNIKKKIKNINILRNLDEILEINNINIKLLSECLNNKINN